MRCPVIFENNTEPRDFVLPDLVKATEIQGPVIIYLQAGWVEQQAEVKGGLSRM